MSKSLTRILYLIAIVIDIIGGVLFSIGAAGSTATTNASGAVTSASVGNPTLVLLGGILLFIGGIVALVALIGALVKTAQLGRWGWFVCLILFSGITLLIYIFAGPTTRKDEAVAYTSDANSYPPQA